MACLNNKAAFRCLACGHLEDSGHAGEGDVPLACSACGAGVEWDKRGGRMLKPDNWQVLADLKPDELAELGFRSDQVERHTPVKKAALTRPPASVGVSATETMVTKDEG